MKLECSIYLWNWYNTFTPKDFEILANKIFTIPYKSPEIMKFFKAYIDTSLIELDYQKAGELMQGFITDSKN
jgi:hypothetical protein